MEAAVRRGFRVRLTSLVSQSEERFESVPKVFASWSDPIEAETPPNERCGALTRSIPTRDCCRVALERLRRYTNQAGPYRARLGYGLRPHAPYALCSTKIGQSNFSGPRNLSCLVRLMKQVKLTSRAGIVKYCFVMKWRRIL
ncbi:hypothetical protein GA845_02620 [Burkholderia pseudomallei]|nr:hypothetical protein [Burkholderia pseudomallei]